MSNLTKEIRMTVSYLKSDSRDLRTEGDKAMISLLGKCLERIADLEVSTIKLGNLYLKENMKSERKARRHEIYKQAVEDVGAELKVMKRYRWLLYRAKLLAENEVCDE